MRIADLSINISPSTTSALRTTSLLPTRLTALILVILAAVASPARSESTPEYIFIEAESGILYEPMVIASDPDALGEHYIHSPISKDGRADFILEVNGGNYVIWALAAATGPNAVGHNSFHVSIDAGPENIWDVNYDAPDGPNTYWQYDIVSTRCGGSADYNQCDPHVFSLSEGPHILHFRSEESHTRLDALIITSDLSFDPRGSEKPSETSVTLGWNAPKNVDGSPVTGLAGFKIHHGPQSRDVAPYEVAQDVGDRTLATVSGLERGPVYHFALTAYDFAGNESAFSSELKWSIGDSDTDGMQDAWEIRYFGSRSVPAAEPSADADLDGISNLDEFIAGSIPTDADSHNRLFIQWSDGQVHITFDAPIAEGAGYENYERRVSIETMDPQTVNLWTPVPGMTALPARGKVDYRPSFSDTAAHLYRVSYSLEPIN